MAEKILLVDDELNILKAHKRILMEEYDLDLATSAKDALELIDNGNKYSVAISDYKMPNMDGIEFLELLKIKSPNTVRIMLTGQSELEVSVSAINKGNIFQFLTKPCEPELLQDVIKLAEKQYKLITAEKELLEKTLKGSVNMLLDILGIARADIFSKVSKIKQYIIQIYHTLKIKRSWSVELAAMFYFVGAITLPEQTIDKLIHGKEFTSDERSMYKESEALKFTLLANIPRLGTVIKVLKYVDMNYSDFSELPEDLTEYDTFIIGAQILKIAISFERLIAANYTNHAEVISILEDRSGLYNSKLLPFFKNIAINIDKREKVSIMIKDMAANMVLAQDVKNIENVLLIAKGQQLTEPMLLCLRNLLRQSQIKEPIIIYQNKA